MRFNPVCNMAGVGLASALAIAAFSQAQASTIPNGSFSGALVGGAVTTTYSGLPGDWKVGITTTQIQVTGGSRQISGVADPFLGAPNNLVSTNGGPVSVPSVFTIPISTYNIASGPITPFTVNLSGLGFTFTDEVVTSVSDGNIGLAFLGTLTSDTSVSANSPYTLGEGADFSNTFTQSAIDGAIGVAQSINVSPNLPVPTPEPATMA